MQAFNSEMQIVFVSEWDKHAPKTYSANFAISGDKFRSKYIYQHLKLLEESSLPIKRYYHWSFTDNFEWCEGESARFGLVHVDYVTQKRTIKQSGKFYSEIIKNQGISHEMYKKYIKS